MFGPDIRSLFITIFLIVAPVAIFCVFVVRHLLHKFPGFDSGYAILVVAIVYTFYVLVLLFLTSARDPGIVPRAPHPPEPEDIPEATVLAEGGGQTPRLRFPRTKDVVVNGILVKIKYCDTCMIYRPPRCSHCSICDNCVERFDHHCPWVGQCIGKRNYVFFFMFVSSATLLCIYVFAMSALYIKFLMKDDHKTVWGAMKRSPASVILMAYSFISVWFVGGLTVFHSYLISTNQTTYENFRYRSENRINPYNLGAVRNFREILCTKIPASKTDFRAKVERDASRHVVDIHSHTDYQDDPGNFRTKIGADMETGGTSTGEHDLELESKDELQSQLKNGHDIGLDIKDGSQDAYQEAFTRALGPLHVDVSDTRSGAHPRQSSWGRKSESWEISPDLLAMDSGARESGRFNGRNIPPERVNK